MTTNCNTRGSGRNPTVGMGLGAMLWLVFISAYFAILANKAYPTIHADPGPSVSISKAPTQSLSLPNHSVAATAGSVDIDDDIQLKHRFYANVVEKHWKAAMERAAKGPYKTLDSRRKPHPGLFPMAPQFRPETEWGQSKFPDINIVGLPKAGTSQLYKILASHPETVKFSKTSKEDCLIGSSEALLTGWDGFVPGPKPTSKQLLLQQKLHATLQKAPSRGVSPQQTVNGCIRENMWSVVHDYLQPPRGKKFIILLRDPADWLWAVYNFWAIPGVDSYAPQKGAWTNPVQHYRSPEMFHELVASSYLLDFFRQSFGDFSLFDNVWQYEFMVGQENILFIRNEDMFPTVVAQKGGVLDQLAQFTGLDRDSFDVNIFGRIVNCNKVKGGVSGDCGTTKSDSYEITGGRSMLPETRILIYLRFHEECKLWSQKYKVVYKECLNALESANPESKSSKDLHE